jgi:phenylpyruvate tautomerase PptA (4-oxalocrotonate tautomerase family)
MPDVLIEVRGSWLGREKSLFLEAIHTALVEALRTVREEEVLRLVEHAPDSFVIPQTAGERFTRIEIVMLSGRSLEAKRALYKAIVAKLKPFGVPPDDVKVVLIEVSNENVGIRGGKPVCDVDLGYEVHI